MMKVLVTGADGMLGRDVMRALREKHVNARGVDMADFDVTDGAADYRLELDSERLTWRLVREADRG